MFLYHLTLTIHTTLPSPGTRYLRMLSPLLLVPSEGSRFFVLFYWVVNSTLDFTLNVKVILFSFPFKSPLSCKFLGHGLPSILQLPVFFFSDQTVFDFLLHTLHRDPTPVSHLVLLLLQLIRPSPVRQC